MGNSERTKELEELSGYLSTENKVKMIGHILPLSKHVDDIDDRLIGVENAVRALQEKPSLPRLAVAPLPTELSAKPDPTPSTTASTTLTTQDYSKQARRRIKVVGIQGMIPEDFVYIDGAEILQAIGNNVKELSNEIAGLRNINNPPGYNDACRRIMEMIAEFVATGKLPRAQPTQTQPGRPGVS